MARYTAMVPINWTHGSTNNFRVPVRFDGEITRESVKKIEELATNYVIRRGQTLAAHGEIKIYRMAD
jgi:hypothetical protein